MIVPLFLEQFLVLLVGMCDTVIVSYINEAAVSGVSLVNQFNTIFIYLFSALASGGAVVISQHIGRQSPRKAGEAASQLLTCSVVLALVLMLLILPGSRAILRFMFGQIEPEVMEAAAVYLRISAYSYPALAIYNVGAAAFRSMGRTDVIMHLSFWSNIINVVGNLIGVFLLKAGVAGVAYPTLIARAFSAVVITLLCFRKSTPVRYYGRDIFSYRPKTVRNILRIAVPNGLENGIFQLVKVALSSVVALFGTYQIAANGVAQSIWSVSALAGVAMGPIYITVIGQCVGAGDMDAADDCFRRLLKITLCFSVAWNGLILLLMPLMLQAFALAPQTKELVFRLVVIHNVFNAFAYPFSGALNCGLRAAGDVRFTTAVSVFSVLAVRLVLSYLLAVRFNLGVIGIALAMAADWIFKAVIYQLRRMSGAWKNFTVLSD